MDNHEPEIKKDEPSEIVEVMVGDTAMLMTKEERDAYLKDKRDGMIDDK